MFIDIIRRYQYRHQVEGEDPRHDQGPEVAPAQVEEVGGAVARHLVDRLAEPDQCPAV